MIRSTFFQEILDKIETVPTNNRDMPLKDVVIMDCGVIPVWQPFTIQKE